MRGDRSARYGRFHRAGAGTAEEVRETVGRYAEAGIDELITPDFTLGDGQRRLDALDRLREEVLVKLS